MALRPRARRLWASLRAERRTLGQGSVALLVSTVAAFVAGLTLGSITGTLEALPGLVILIPASVGMRGSISGSIGARLGTATHVGTFAVEWNRAGVLYQNVYAGVILTLSSSLYVATLARLAAGAFGLPSISLVDLVTISVLGGALGSVIVLVATIGLAVLSYRRGYDLDAVATPVITAVGDMVTLPALFLATFVVRADAANAIVSAGCVALGLGATVLGVLTRPPLRRILLEMTGVLVLAPVLDILAGAVLQANLSRFLAFPGLLVLVPPFVSQAGALGGILSSRLSSKIQLGVISPRVLPETPAVVDASLVVGFGALVFLMIAILGESLALVTGHATPGFATTVRIVMVAGILATALVLVLSYYVAVLTTRRGLDPDNHGVPLITSLMDLAGVLCVLAAMTLSGVAVHG